MIFHPRNQMRNQIENILSRLRPSRNVNFPEKKISLYQDCLCHTIKDDRQHPKRTSTSSSFWNINKNEFCGPGVKKDSENHSTV